MAYAKSANWSPDLERKGLYTPAEVAAIVGVSSQTVLDWIHDGDLFAIRLSERIYRIPLGALMQKLGYPQRVRRQVNADTNFDPRADAAALTKEHSRRKR